MAASDAYDEGLMFSNDGAKVFLQDRSSLKFETDACGLLVSVPNRKAKFAQSALADDLDDFDGDDPSVEGQVLLTRWLSMHPEIAVVTDGIDKWCGDESFVGDDVVPDSIASWRSPDIGPPATAYIA